MIHVDDLLWVGGPRMDDIMARVKAKYSFGSLDSKVFRYCGRLIEQTETGVKVTCPDLITRVRPIQLRAAPPWTTRSSSFRGRKEPAAVHYWVALVAYASVSA